MINKDRIVPITRTDLISMYGLIAIMATEQDGGVVPISAVDAEGNFEMVEKAQTSVIADEPVATFDFGTNVNGANVFFVPAYDYAGFTAEGAALVATGDEVEADGCTLYVATFNESALTIHKVGF